MVVPKASRQAADPAGCVSGFAPRIGIRGGCELVLRDSHLKRIIGYRTDQQPKRHIP